MKLNLLNGGIQHLCCFYVNFTRLPLDHLPSTTSLLIDRSLLKQEDAKFQVILLTHLWLTGPRPYGTTQSRHFLPQSQVDGCDVTVDCCDMTINCYDVTVKTIDCCDVVINSCHDCWMYVQYSRGNSAMAYQDFLNFKVCLHWLNSVTFISTSHIHILYRNTNLIYLF